MAKRTLEDIIKDKYDDVTVAQDVLADVNEKGTEKAILAGELVLPHPQDALTFSLRKRGLLGASPSQVEDRSRMDALEQLVAEMASQLNAPTKERKAAIEERVASLKGGGK